MKMASRRPLPTGGVSPIVVALTIVAAFSLGFWVSTRELQRGLESSSGERRAAHSAMGHRAADTERGRHEADVPAALEAIERALEMTPHLREALFNRALALERLYLLRSARRAWQAYLEVDTDSPWALEARQRMDAIVLPTRPDPTRLRTEIIAAASVGDADRLAELVLAHRGQTRRVVQEELLPGWAAEWLAADLDEANRQLRATETIAREWEAQTADRTLREAVEEVKSASGVAPKRLAAGYMALAEASQAFDAFELGAAERSAVQALEALPRASPAATWAELVRLACVAYRGGDIEVEGHQLARHARGDIAGVGRVHWIVGLQHATRGRLTKALAQYHDSLAAYKAVGDSDSIAWLHHLTGEVYGAMGATELCWQHRRLALEHAPSMTDGQRAASVLVDSARLALAGKQPRTAVDFLDEALSEPALKSPDQTAQVYLWRSRVLQELHRADQAQRDLANASAWLARAKPLERRYLGGDLNLVAGLLEPEPTAAVARITRALERFRTIGPSWRLPGVFLARARAHMGAGDVSAADADLGQGLALLDEQAKGDAAAWGNERDEAQQLFDERIQLALRQGRDEEAFGIAEAGRAWGLRQLEISPRESQPQGVTTWEVRQQLETGATVVFYSWLPDRVVLWRLAKDGWRFVETQTPPHELARLVATLGADLESGAWTTMTRETAIRLYAALVAPAGLRPGPVVIVPDKELHALPFAALVDPQSGRFLVEEHEITVAPSAAAFLRGQALWAKRRELPNAGALVVGDPQIDRLVLPDFRPLAGARREARAIAALYPQHEVLLGGAATRTAFIDALPQKGIVHFSGHAVANRIDPARSSLPLSGGGTETNSLLVASDIAKLDLSSTRAVVLSGCETGAGSSAGNEGPRSLARAFLVAGVPNVVASLWPIVDVPSTPLMTALHRRLQRGERPPAALRAAQIELLGASDPILRSPSVWAAFEAFGG